MRNTQKSRTGGSAISLFIRDVVFWKFVFILLCALLLPGCLATKGDINGVKRTQRRLEKEIAQLQEGYTSNYNTLDARAASLEGRVKAVEHALLKVREKGADSGASRAVLERELRRLRGEIEEMRIDMEAKESAARKSREQRSSSSQPVNGEGSFQPKSGALGSTDESRNAANGSPSDALLLEQASDALSGKEYRKAIANLKRLEARLSPSDQRWTSVQLRLGAANYFMALDLRDKDSQGRLLKSSIFAYQKVLDLESDPGVPEALFGIGRSFEALNLKKDAKVFYQEIVSQHQSSEWASDAQKRLRALKNIR